MGQRASKARGGVSYGRRLAFELLESRDLLAVMRIVDWNTLNGPNDEAGDARVQTVLAAIGNETVQGNTKRLDILALQETDPAGPGGNSIGRIESILDALYPTTNYASQVSSEDGGNDSTGFVWDTSSVSLESWLEVSPMSLTHRILRGQFRPAGTAGESDVFVYSVHLKAGDTLADEAARANEAAILRADADALGEGAQVIFVGDFNMKDSGEAAWSTLYASGAAQLQDVADAPGNWNNNPAFRHLHTQDPRRRPGDAPAGPGTGMDDRFDIMFASGELFDGIGLDYIDDSFRVFGNNGTHTFDQSITTTIGIDPVVLGALADSSDHLPIVADFELLISTPGVRITETGGNTKVVEGGLVDTYSIVLDTVPSANVTITVMPDGELDVGNGPGSSRQFVFTPADALTPQTVVVTAFDDSDDEGNHLGFITHISASTDPEYDALAIDSITVDVVDDDDPVILINEIDSDTSGTDELEFVELYDGGVGNVSLDGYTVVFFNGSNNQAYATFILDGYATGSDGFFVLGNEATPNIDLQFSDGLLQNGQDAVALYFGGFTGPGVTTTNLRDAIVYDTNDADDAELLVLLLPGQPQVNESQNGESAGTMQSLARVPDGGLLRTTETYVAQTPTPGAPNQSQVAGVIITHSGTRVDVEEGGATDSYQISLQTVPTADVLITVDPDEETDLGSGPGVAVILTFTPANALFPQLVTVAAIDDAEAEGTHTSVITHSAASSDSAYNGISIANVVANIVDNDAPPVQSIVISEIMYDPDSDEQNPGVAEWIEIVNAGGGAVDIGGWLFDDEDSSNWGPIPANTTLNPGQVAVFYDEELAFDGQPVTEQIFRDRWSVPAGSLVIPIAWGSLANSPNSIGNEVLRLLDTAAMQIDAVDLEEGGLWPADGPDGPSVYLKALSADNNNGSHWAKSAVGVANAISPTGPEFSTSDVGSPGWLPLAGDYNSDFRVDAGDYVRWRNTLGSTMDLRADGSGPTPGIPDGVVDQFDYAWWKSHYGDVLVLGGSGSGGLTATLTAEGELETTTAAPDAAPLSIPPVLAPLSLPQSDMPILARTLPLGGESTASLLLAVKYGSAGHTDAEDFLDVLSESAKDETAAVDEVFAILGELALVPAAE